MNRLGGVLMALLIASTAGTLADDAERLLTIDHFVRVARGEEASRCTVQDARLSLALAEMALSSHRSGLPVRASTLTDFSGPTG